MQTEQRTIPIYMYPMLRAPGLDNHARETLGINNIGSYREIPNEPWTGASVGVRCPTKWETPLSASEIATAITFGILK